MACDDDDDDFPLLHEKTPSSSNPTPQTLDFAGKCPPFCFPDDPLTFSGDRKTLIRPEKRKEAEDSGDSSFAKKHHHHHHSGPKILSVSSSSCSEIKKDREEWSDCAINSLLEAYTEKYVELNRGNLRGRDWDEVAMAVSARKGGKGGTKSVEQCKNKVDNLKKRYKAERQRMGGSGMSHWPWFKKMEEIVGGGGGGVKSGGEGEEAVERERVVSSGVVSVVGNSGRQAKRYTVVSPNTSGLPNTLKTKSLSNPRWRRVVFKISGAALAGNGSQNVDPKVTSLIAREVVAVNRLGVEVAIVVGGRNFFCGESWTAATGLDRTAADQIGMMATVMNSILLQASIENLGTQTRLQTAFKMAEVAEPYIRRRAIRHLEKGRVVIFGAGTGNPYFTTDTAAALRASEINAEAVLKGTNADGLYDCDSRNSSNVGFEHMSYRDMISRGLSASMDITAIHLCEENCIPVVIFNLLEPGNISRALCGDPVGILIDQSARIS
ncbi:uncharacterized protein LOC18434064 isoform X2 [Amborella trichopoda]|uniref:UMP kinase n=1 Tax=Amborella trichopoda TaxID=13333 RepID=W1P7M4_AMBTC|nr:uncharacterized protein LOC18434064 isoform X2 [Amborella trichopoda]ERN05877.1 hypothetical protein AMTR_s00006p00265300 [Amborella trichopoda]|eukprot:XP_006844202.1 uncharacterized protein LOC18434064 isoform X2 [Amborella trichopoda]